MCSFLLYNTVDSPPSLIYLSLTPFINAEFKNLLKQLFEEKESDNYNANERAAKESKQNLFTETVEISGISSPFLVF